MDVAEDNALVAETLVAAAPYAESSTAQRSLTIEKDVTYSEDAKVIVGSPISDLEIATDLASINVLKNFWASQSLNLPSYSSLHELTDLANINIIKNLWAPQSPDLSSYSPLTELTGLANINILKNLWASQTPDLPFYSHLLDLKALAAKTLDVHPHVESSTDQSSLTNGEGKEEVKDANELKMNTTEDRVLAAKNLDALPYAESSTTQRSLTKDKDELEHHGQARIAIDFLLSMLEKDEAKKYGLATINRLKNLWASQALNFPCNSPLFELTGVQRLVGFSQSKGEEMGKVMDIDVKMNNTEDRVLAAKTSDAPPYAELSMAQRSLDKGKGKLEHRGDVRIPIDFLLMMQEKDRAKKYGLANINDLLKSLRSLPPLDLPCYSPLFELRARSAVERSKNVKRSIHKVHSGLRHANAEHYEPSLVSIGPYHHGKTPLQDMEMHKIHYLQVLLDRMAEERIARYVTALNGDEGEPQALDCYLDTFQMDLDSFQKCMVRDGLFIIELFRRNMRFDYYTDLSSDMIFNISWMKPRLERDMLLLENQIPLFVLRKLFELTEAIYQEGDFVRLVLRFFEFNGKQIPSKSDLKIQLDEIPHLLGLIYEALVPKQKQQDEGEKKFKLLRYWRECFGRIAKAFMRETHKELNGEWKSFEFIRTVVALKEVGVTFVKADDNAAFHGIEYRDGVLSIPRLVIHDNTESFFRNLVAYEQYSKNYSLHRVTDYLRVMDCLINSSKDVELLRHCGIIDNRIGDDAKVSTMFNQLCSGVYFDQDKFFYTQMFGEVNKFCKNRRNVWIAKLKNEYFGSPWTLISFLAAVMLLLLTIVQTVFSVLSYYK